VAEWTREQADYWIRRGLARPPQTILELLAWRARQEPDQLQFVFLGEGEERVPLSVLELWSRSQRIARYLSTNEVGRGCPVILLLPPDETFVLALLGTQMAGAVPAAIYPPSSVHRLAEQAARSLTIVREAAPACLLTCSLLQPFARLLASQVPGAPPVLLVEDALRATDSPVRALPRPTADDIAFLQYSSGSTGDPKGVAIPHRSLLAQLWLLGQAVPPLLDPVTAPQERVVSWLPPYHDMGLVGCIFFPIHWGFVAYLASPLAFVRHPARWLHWITALHATQTVAPNFAYQRCATRLRDQDLVGLDLSSLRVAWNGAEPVRQEAVAGFVARFAPCGFDPRAMFPVYGLAEYTLCATHPRPGEGALFEHIDRRRWEEEGVAEPRTGDPPEVLPIAAVGFPGTGTEVTIRDAAGAALGERVRGEIWVRGSSLMAGYHGRPRESALLPDGWLRTGDLGYLAGGRLFVAGRGKDLIIVLGRNVFPEDVEEAACRVPGIRPGHVVAFGVDDPAAGTEAVTVLFEPPRPTVAAGALPAPEVADLRELARRIRQVVIDGVGVVPHRVVPVPVGWVERTSSGKLRRAQCRERYLAAGQELGSATGAS